jgi:cytoskeletal protein CcmA (bactofilin family)
VLKIKIERRSMWTTKKSNTPLVVASRPKALQTDKQIATTIHPVDSTAYRPTGWLGPTLHVKGDITGNDDLLVDGSVEGTIQLDGRTITVGAAAKLKADINAHDVVVSGHVKGNVRATRRIDIKKDASVVGNLTTPEIMIEQGADFKGSIEIDRSETKKPDHDVPTLPVSPAAAGLTTSGSSQDAWTN